MSIRFYVIWLWQLPFISFAANYPLEFTDFFIKERGEINFSIAGDAVGTELDVELSYDEVRLLTTSQPQLVRYLNDAGVAPHIVEQVVDELTQGAVLVPLCDPESNATCNIMVTGEQVKYQYSYDDRQLVVYLGSQALKTREQYLTYHASTSEGNALINQMRLYGQSSDLESSTFRVNNITMQGLPYGHILVNSQYSQQSALELYQGYYDLTIDNARMLVGYNQYNQVSLNSSDFLNDYANYHGYSAIVGSTRNLVKGGEEGLQSLVFFSPQVGQLEVYQGERLLLTKVVEQGVQVIGYDELPSGSYEVRLVLKASGKSILEERRYIVNSQQFSLQVGEVDYVVNFGKFDLPGDREGGSASVNSFSNDYLQYRTTWRSSEHFILGGAVTTNQEDIYGQTGLIYMFSDWLSLTYQVGIFNTADIYQSATLGAGRLTISTQQYHRDEQNELYRLSSKLYGDSEFDRFDVALSHSLWGGDGYISYSHARYGVESFDAQTYRATDSVLEALSLGWVTSMAGWTLGLNGGVNRASSNLDEFTFGLTASYALRDKWSSNFAINTNSNGSSYEKSSLTRQLAGDSWRGSITPAIEFSRDTNGVMRRGSISGSLMGQNPWFSGSGYAYVDDDELGMASTSLTSTQIISSDGLHMTSKVGSSFIRVEADKQLDEATLSGVEYHLRQNKKRPYRSEFEDDVAIIPLTPYKEVEFSIDADATDVYVNSDNYAGFVHPATVRTVKATVGKVVSHLFVLNEVDGTPVKRARCVGSACLGIEPVSEDGVFRVSYRTPGQFNIISSNKLCVNEPALMKDGVIYTKCLPGLLADEGRIVFKPNETTVTEGMLYLGRYSVNQELTTMLESLERVGLTPERVDLGSYAYLYIPRRQSFTLAQRMVLEALEVYIVLNYFDIKNTLSAVRVTP
ncbi:TcfC E-set like domain-containing protein [Aeromonas veronii]